MDYYFYSDPGTRDANEDSLKIVQGDYGFCAIVADGLGGQGNGDVASKNVVNTIAENFVREHSSSPENIEGYFKMANDAVMNISGGKQTTMSTAVCFFMAKEGAFYAHVGDSRFYHFLDGKLIERSYDHSVPQVSVALGEITEDQIRNHPDRNRVLRAIGASHELKTEIHSIELSKGFHAFILCSDGFWENVLESEMEIDLSKSNMPEDWYHYLMDRYNSRKPPDADNNTAIFIFMNI